MDLRINISHVRIEIDTRTSASLVATELKTLNGPGIWENVLIVLGMDWRLSDAEAVFSTFPETCLIPSKSALAFASVQFTSFGSGCSDVMVELMFAMPKSEDWSRFRSGVMVVGGGRRSWLALGRRMYLAPELAAVGSWFGDCRALRAKRLPKHLGINLDNPLRDPFLGGREDGCNHYWKQRHRCEVESP